MESLEQAKLWVKQMSGNKPKRERWTGLDYWVRCLLTGDEEETRLWEDVPEVLKDLKSAGATSRDLAKAKEVLVKRVAGYKAERGSRAQLSWEMEGKLEQKLIDIFSKYVSHKSLWKAGTWEAAYEKKLMRE